MADSTTTAVEAAEAASSSSAATAAKFVGTGVGMGILAMVGVDAYNGIKSLIKGRSEEKKSEADIRKDERLRTLEEVHAKKSKK